MQNTHLFFRTLAIVAFFTLSLSESSYAQKNELGFGLGGFNYTGDLVRDFAIKNTRPGLGVLYRRNFNNYFSVRGAVHGGWLAGSDNPPYDALAQQRDTSFSISVVELSAVAEYHFLDWKNNIHLLRWTPYFFVGVGVSFFGAHGEPPVGSTPQEGYSRTQPVIPVGVGFKYMLTPVWVLSLEGGIRKTFTDYIDNVADSDLRIKNYEYGNPYTNDFYYYVGFSLSYTFYTIPCPYHF